MSAACAHPLAAGATPPLVFTRCMNVVSDSVAPPVGPSSVPTARSSTQGTAPGTTKAGSVELATAAAHTALVSCEDCHVTRGVFLSSGLGLRKCVITCWAASLNNVACGAKNVHP